MSSARIAPSAASVPYSRIRELAETAMRLDAEAPADDRVLKLYFGESNIPTPDFIKQAAQQAMADGFTYYTENAGMLSTRQALARYYGALHNVDLDPVRNIVVTNSGVQALNVGIRCLLDPGDEAIVLTPAWPNGSAIAQMANAVVKQVAHPLRGDRYGIDFEAIEAALSPRTRMILYTSPSNPTGWVATEEDQERLLELCRSRGIWLMADEVYERLWYNTGELGTAVPTILKRARPDDPVIVVQSFSKAWCMTGWRVGWMISRPDLVARAGQLNEFIISCPTGFAQKAAEVALAQGEASVREMLAGFKRNRDLCLQALNRMPGVRTPMPDGAFYLFPRIDGLTDSFNFCRELLLQTKVGLAPGVAFGNGGEGSIRICYASEPHILASAMARLEAFLRSR
ncbi:MAG: pyridoxal phosphate-dependent aminotransferase [Bryobacterales bacterium]|nr:pyridoxal phosphate-dependent aminotransferase [Bryobacterales bacterium]